MESAFSCEGEGRVGSTQPLLRLLPALASRVQRRRIPSGTSDSAFLPTGPGAAQPPRAAQPRLQPHGGTQDNTHTTSRTGSLHSLKQLTLRSRYFVPLMLTDLVHTSHSKADSHYAQLPEDKLGSWALQCPLFSWFHDDKRDPRLPNSHTCSPSQVWALQASASPEQLAV